jgi:hypothetical protein
MQNLWERACSRMRWVNHYQCRLTRPLREQARSHRDSGVSDKIKKGQTLQSAPLVSPSAQNLETLLIASTKYLIAIRSLSDSSRYRSTNFISSELSRRLRRPVLRHGNIPSSSVMPCTFDMDDVLLIRQRKLQKTASPSTFFSKRLVRAEPTGLKGRNRLCP